MKLISHRGNLNGRLKSSENEPNYIDNAISKGYDVEVDVWFKNDELYLGHDFAQYKINLDFLLNISEKLWIHCKNVEAMEFLIKYNLHLFWHQEDDITLTTQNYIWTYPGKKIINNAIAVMPELIEDWDISKAFGVCSDFIEKYK
jgi:hypothetical protein